jgi:hypothetical protein
MLALSTDMWVSALLRRYPGKILGASAGWPAYGAAILMASPHCLCVAAAMSLQLHWRVHVAIFQLTTFEPHMSKTPKQDLDDKIEALQLKLIEENAVIGALRPMTLEEFDGTRAQELRQHEGRRDGIKEQIAFLTAKKIHMSSTPTHRRGAKTTKQAAVYKEIVKLKKRNPKLTNEEAIEQLAEKLGDSQEAIHKGFYAEQKKLIGDAARSAREKRDSEGETDPLDRDGK